MADRLLFAHTHFALIVFCFYFLFFFKLRYCYYRETEKLQIFSDVYQSSSCVALPCLMPHSATISFQFLQHLLFPACLPIPSVGSEVQKYVLGGRKACRTYSRLFCVIRTSSQMQSCGEDFHKRGKYLAVLCKMEA